MCHQQVTNESSSVRQLSFSRQFSSRPRQDGGMHVQQFLQESLGDDHWQSATLHKHSISCAWMLHILRHVMDLIEQMTC